MHLKEHLGAFFPHLLQSIFRPFRSIYNQFFSAFLVPFSSFKHSKFNAKSIWNLKFLAFLGSFNFRPIFCYLLTNGQILCCSPAARLMHSLQTTFPFTPRGVVNFDYKNPDSWLLHQKVKTRVKFVNLKSEMHRG